MFSELPTRVPIIDLSYFKRAHVKSLVVTYYYLLIVVSLMVSLSGTQTDQAAAAMIA